MTLADVRVGLRAYLIDDGAIAARIDSGAAATLRYRLFSLKLPQGETRDSIVYSKISGLGDHHMQGPSGLARPRIQIDSWAKEIDDAVTLSGLVKERIDGFRGSILWGEDSPAEAVVVLGIFFESDREDYDDTAKLYRVSQDYFIWFRER